jgi:Predicted hydrolases of the HAD superfamily
MESKIIAVDFDGTLVTNAYPDIGNPIENVVFALKCEQNKGARIILWTCRRGELLAKAVDWCEARGIRLAAVNENLPDVIEAFGGDTRKVFANEYWDDRAVAPFEITEERYL